MKPHGVAPIVLVRFFVFNTKGEVLLLRRSATDEHRPGGWDLPGGVVEPNENPNQTLTREVREETGLNVHEATIFYVASQTSPQHIITLFYQGVVVPGQVALSHEHSDYQWAPATKIATLGMPQKYPDAAALLHNQLLVLRDSDVTGAVNQAHHNYKKRTAARAVMFDAAGQVALLHVRQQNYHKLPGGGVEPGEDILAALQRELLEETGCQATVQAEIGSITEFRDQEKLHQTSRCFVAHQTGSQASLALTAEEQADGFELTWAPNITSAIAILQRDTPKNYDGKFIQKRDTAFLQAAQEFLQ